MKFIPGKTNILYGGRVYDHREIDNLIKSAKEFWLTDGHFCDEFSQGLSKFIGVEHCVLCNSGSSANLLAVSALTSPMLKERRLDSGDEVITTACGFPTTLNPILQNNLIPVFIDIELGTYNIDYTHIEKFITKKTKAIFIPHTLGNPFNVNAIMNISKRYNLWVIEDNCDALGSKYHDRFTGSFGDMSTLSFFPAHHITTGEGGAVLTDNPLLKKALLSFRDWGRDCWCKPGTNNTCQERFDYKLNGVSYDHKYIYSHIGYNFKMTEMQASIGVAQLEKLSHFIKIRQRNFRLLYDFFRKYYGSFILPHWELGVEPSPFGFPLIVNDRERIVRYLEANKIHTRLFFGGNLLKQPAYKGIKYRSDKLTNTNLVMNNGFWIGVYPGITVEMIDYIKKTIKEYIYA